MSTTIEALRKLGKKVNDKEPTSNGIGNIVNEIADDYAGGSGSAGVSSIGGVDGAITLGTGLSMSGQQLQVSASGGTQLYKHAVTFTSNEVVGGGFTIPIISLTSNQYVDGYQMKGDLPNIISISSVNIDGEEAFIMLDTEGGVDAYDIHLIGPSVFYCDYVFQGEYNTAYITYNVISDTVTAL